MLLLGRSRRVLGAACDSGTARTAAAAALGTGGWAAVLGWEPRAVAAAAAASSAAAQRGVRGIHAAGIERVEARVGGGTVGFEAGRLARLADGAVVCDLGDTAVLTTVVSEHSNFDEREFLQLQVDYRERAAAAGRIPTSYNRRDGAPKDREILVARNVDRAIRPLFPTGYNFATHIHSTPLSVAAEDGAVAQDPEALCINAASAALMLSDIPWAGPVGAVRVALVDGAVVVNPPAEAAARATLQLLYAGTAAQRVLMADVQAAGAGVPEAALAAALRAAAAAAAELIEPQRELAARLGRPKRLPRMASVPPAAAALAADAVGPSIEAVLRQGGSLDKAARGAALSNVRASMSAVLGTSGYELGPQARSALFDGLVSAAVRRLALGEGLRPDGRALTEMRPLLCEAGVLSRVHGSALFDRGETQVLATATLGALEEGRKGEGAGEDGGASRRFTLHYAFPPFSVNETGRAGGVTRREIGHGALAERALAGVVPSAAQWPFSVRLSAETLGSNGSSSMAAVCAGSLALMDAGVPLAEHVAGVAVGLVQRDPADRPAPAAGAAAPPRAYALLLDLQGTEDHYGDMDLKVAGTRGGVTAVQLDVKAAGGVALEIVEEGLEAARGARGAVLDAMAAVLPAPRAARAASPRSASVPIEREMVGRVIGPQGSVIRDMERQSECRIQVVDGDAGAAVTIFAPHEAAMAAARAHLDAILGSVARAGATYTGRVVSLKDFGAFVELPSGEQGLLHISEVAHHRTYRIEDALAVEQRVEVMVLAKDPKGNLRLSMKALVPPPAGGDAVGAPGEERPPPPPAAPAGPARAFATRRAGAEPAGRRQTE